MGVYGIEKVSIFMLYHVILVSGFLLFGWNSDFLFVCSFDHLGVFKN